MWRKSGTTGGGRSGSRKAVSRSRRSFAARHALPVLESLEDRRLMAIDTLTPVADTFVCDGSYNSTNYGRETGLVTKLDSAGYTRNTFLRFDLKQIQGKVTGATLRLYPTSSGAGGITNALATAGSDNWNEDQLTWQDRPSRNEEIATWQVQSGQWVEVDVTAAVQTALGGDGMLSLAVFATQDHGSDGWVSYGSREASSSVRPVLKITSTRSNTAPVAKSDGPLQVSRNAAFTGDGASVLDNDTDADHDKLSAVKLSDPHHGSVTFHSNGTFTYTPTPGYVGNDSFTYVVDDGTTQSAPATVSFVVANRAPTAADD